MHETTAYIIVVVYFYIDWTCSVGSYQLTKYCLPALLQEKPPSLPRLRAVLSKYVCNVCIPTDCAQEAGGEQEHARATSPTTLLSPAPS